MNAQLFLNNFDSQFIASVKSAPTTGTPASELDYGIVRVSQSAGAILGVLANGDYYILTAFKRSGSNESSVEVMKVTNVDTSVINETRLTVLRGQEGTTPESYVAGDYVSLRFTAASASGLLQKSGNLAGLADTSAARANIGAAPTASPSFTGNVSLTSSGARILGDFSNASHVNRTVFQSSVENGVTGLVAMPNGSATTTAFNFYNRSDILNSAVGYLNVSAEHVRVGSGFTGSGTPLPLTLATSFVDRQIILPTGEVGIGVAPTVGQGTLQVSDINGGAASGFKNKIINGCMRVSKKGNGQAFLGSNFKGADGIITTIGIWSALHSSAILMQETLSSSSDVRATAGGIHYLGFGTTPPTGAGGYVVFAAKIEAADAVQLGGKVCMLSAKLTSWVTAPTNHYFRVYKAGALNDFSAPTQLNNSANLGPLTVNVTTTVGHRFIPALADCVNGLMVEVVCEYSTALGASAYLFLGDYQLRQSSQIEPFELRPIAIEEQLRRRYYQTRAVRVNTSTAPTCIPIDMVKVPTISGGGTGFSSTGTTADTLICSQTTSATQTLVLNAEL